MEDYFIVPMTKMKSNSHRSDLSLELFVLEYCEEVLHVPLYVVHDASYTEEGIALELRNLEDWMIGEAWYINLFQMSRYAMAS